VFPRGYPHNPQTLGQWIRKRRLDCGLNQDQLAERLGCSIQAIGRWEGDRSSPDPTRWPQIEALLGPGLFRPCADSASQLRVARFRLGWTQQELAERAGLDVRTVKNAELGDRRTNKNSLKRLWGTLSVESVPPKRVDPK